MTRTLAEAKARLMQEIRNCVSAVRCDSSAPVGDCSPFIDAVIRATLLAQGETETGNRKGGDDACSDGYCSVCGAIALFGSDRCEDHPSIAPLGEVE